MSPLGRDPLPSRHEPPLAPGPRPALRRTATPARRTGRVHRPLDLLAAIGALCALGVVIGFAHGLPVGSSELSGDIAKALAHVPRWLAVAAEVVVGLASLGLVVVGLFALARTELQGALNAGVAAVLAATAAAAASSAWEGGHDAVARTLLGDRNPTTFILDTAYLAFLVGSDLVRRSHWSRASVSSGLLVLVTGLVIDALTPFAVGVSLFGALFFGWATRWAIGAASVRPTSAEIEAYLVSHGLAVSELGASAERGDLLSGRLADGTAIEVRVADRDTRGSGIVRRVWAFVRLRPAAIGRGVLSPRARLEQLALASYLAAEAGVIAPAVLTLREMPVETMLLVLAPPDGTPFNAAPSFEHGEAVFSALRSLHDAGVAHRDLRGDNLIVADGRAGFSSLDAALPGAGELVRRIDVTQLLTTLGRAVSVTAAVAALRTAYRPSDEGAIAATLQPIALAPWGWPAMRESRACVAEVRHELLGSGGTAPIARLERFRWRTVVSTIALTIAAFVLVGQISKVDLLGALRQARPEWFAVAVLGSAITYLAAATNLAAFVPKRLSMVRGYFVQLASAFVGVAMPPTVGHIAVNARYLAHEQVDEGSIAAAVTLSQVVNVITTVPLLIALGLLTGSGISRFHIVPSADILIGLAVVAAIVAVIIAVPATRAKFNHLVWPRLRNVWPRLLDAMSQPARLGVGIGANLALTAGYLLAFMAALYAVGAKPAILPTAVVYLAGNTVGSAAPTPGGLGAVEAALSAGLTAIGIPAHEAIPAVLIFRIATFWLPIPAGWISFVFLQRKRIL